MSGNMKLLIARCLWVALVVLPASWAGVVPDRYIVELTAAPAAERVAASGRRPSRSLLTQHRSQVRAEQQSARLAIEQQGGQVLGSIDTVANALIVHMPASAVARLAQVPGVKRVHPVRQFRMLLDHAVIVTKVSDAWNAIGLDRAGLGMKIGMIDSGIDITHPAFKDTSLTVPAGFPKVNQSSDTSFTNNKVIVARSYASLFAATDPDTSARDESGHGTATAMAAAGELVSGPLATIRGVAPKAYLGSYKVFGSPGVNDTAPEDAILTAINDAVTDGMDVINLSLGDALAENLDQDVQATAIQQATSLGVIVVVAAGNTGPGLHTIGPPGSAPAAITVGASSNERTFGGTATVGGTAYLAIPGNGPSVSEPVTAPLKSVAALDGNGLGCTAQQLPAGSLKGAIAFILRGTCLFQDKINNAQAAGAVGVLVYTYASQPDPFTMAVGTATLPAMLVGYQDGTTINSQLRSGALVSATLNFATQPFPVNPDSLADFTSKGPDVDYSIKPDLVSVGTNFYTAAQVINPNGDVYDPSGAGYALVDGTSFSSPMVAGAAALLKAARPGLTVAEYRSLLVNTTAQAYLSPGVPARVQEAGAGLLDMSAALGASSAETPTSISFGTGSANVQQSRTLSIVNVGSAPETFTIFAEGRNAPIGPVPPGSRTADELDTAEKQPIMTVSIPSLQLNPGASAKVTVTMTGFSLPAGAYEGYIHVLG